MKTIPPHPCSSFLLCLFLRQLSISKFLTPKKKEREREKWKPMDSPAPILSLFQSQSLTYFTAQLFFPLLFSVC